MANPRGDALIGRIILNAGLINECALLLAQFFNERQMGSKSSYFACIDQVVLKRCKFAMIFDFILIAIFLPEELIYLRGGKFMGIASIDVANGALVTK